MVLKRSMLAVIFVLSFSLMAQAIQVSFYMGEVTIIRNGKSIAVTTGIHLYSGDIITTGSTGMVEIVYSDNSKVIVREKSRVRIGSASVRDSENPALLLGSVTGKFQKLARGSHKIYATTAVCAVRGTEFDVTVSESGDSRVDVKKGSVAVYNPQGETTVGGGEQAQAAVAQKPEKGSLDELVAWLKQKDGDIDAQPGDSARRYGSYVKSLGRESEETGAELGGVRAMITHAKKTEHLEHPEKVLQSAEEELEDNIMLTESVSEALTAIAENFKRRKNRVYREFERVKKESNAVFQTQKRAMDDIQSLKDEMKAARERIMGSYRDDSQTFKQGVDIDRVKPEIKKYDVK
jgi:hypothetical protein